MAGVRFLVIEVVFGFEIFDLEVVGVVLVATENGVGKDDSACG